ncbi:MAG: RNA methyltransferase, partial [Planctomycetota bacterium]
MTEKLTSVQNPRIKRVVKLRQRRQRERERSFLIEGYRELTRAIEGAFPISELYHCPEMYLGDNEPALVAAIAASGAECFEVAPVVFEKIAYRDRPEGLLGVAPTADWGLDRIDVSGSPLLIVATSIEKPGNLGTILRCADAAGARGVIVCDRVTDIFNPNVVRASIGNLFTVPIAEAETAELLSWLRTHQIRSVATSPDATLCY